MKDDDKECLVSYTCILSSSDNNNNNNNNNGGEINCGWYIMIPWGRRVTIFYQNNNNNGGVNSTSLL